jgi:hypothetical protein
VSDIKTRACGAVHPDGVVCSLMVMVQEGCCHEKVFEHEEPHSHCRDDGTVTHRWEAVLVVKDLPYDAYSPVKNAQ